MQHRPVVSAPFGVPYPFTALRRTGNRLGVGGAEQRPMPVGAIAPDEGPAGGASNIGVLVFLRFLPVDWTMPVHPVAACVLRHLNTIKSLRACAIFVMKIKLSSR